MCFLDIAQVSRYLKLLKGRQSYIHVQDASKTDTGELRRVGARQVAQHSLSSSQNLGRIIMRASWRGVSPQLRNRTP